MSLCKYKFELVMVYDTGDGAPKKMVDAHKELEELLEKVQLKDVSFVNLKSVERM